LDVRDVTPTELEQLNLRTLGWADEYVFAKRQASLDSLCAAARRRPGDIIRPRQLCEVILLGLDPDDPSLAVENTRRGWPAYLRSHNGEPRDYVVIPTNAPRPGR
jgi:hypothetical protein